MCWRRDVRAGDCVVTFSRDDIHAVKRLTEEVPGTKCCVVYGTLPPDAPNKRACSTTEGNGVRHDAIGMGLNLNRKRLFRRVLKYAGNAPSEARSASVAPEYGMMRAGQLPADRRRSRSREELKDEHGLRRRGWRRGGHG